MRQAVTSIEAGRYTAPLPPAVQPFRPFAPVAGDAHYAGISAGIQVGLPAGLAPAAACVPVKSAAGLRGEHKRPARSSSAKTTSEASLSRRKPA